MSSLEGSKITPEQYHEWMSHASDNLGPNTIACCVLTGFFATVFVALRLLGRRVKHGSLHLFANDWLFLISWVHLLLSSLF